MLQVCCSAFSPPLEHIPTDAMLPHRRRHQHAHAFGSAMGEAMEALPRFLCIILLPALFCIIPRTRTNISPTQCNAAPLPPTSMHVHLVWRCRPQHTAAHCNILLHTAPHCNTLIHTATHWNSLQHTATHYNTLRHTGTHCNTQQHSATLCNTLQHSATHSNTLSRTAKYCNTLQHTTTNCNTVQRTGPSTTPLSLLTNFGRKLSMCAHTIPNEMIYMCVHVRMLSE